MKITCYNACVIRCAGRNHGFAQEPIKLELL